MAFSRLVQTKERGMLSRPRWIVQNAVVVVSDLVWRNSVRGVFEGSKCPAMMRHASGEAKALG
jgi:hypothetical protein